MARWAKGGPKKLYVVVNHTKDGEFLTHTRLAAARAHYRELKAGGFNVALVKYVQKED